MPKPNTTRTYGPIHFEDLDPHRFEDLIRELIYDYKDWQSIEATGRSGSDEGFDIRAYEKVIRRDNTAAAFDDEDGDIEIVSPMEGNLWMIQGKREKSIGPKKIRQILEDIDESSPPYGYILAASANFSKAAYDTFRNNLKVKGVMEFYLWGKGELEDMLHMPKNDRILFTFFGISLVSKRRSRATEIRTSVTNKNKLYRIFGEDIRGRESILLRDTNDDKYPFSSQYTDFVERPRWKEYIAVEYHPLGLVFQTHKYYAFIDKGKKEWDFTNAVDITFRQNEEGKERKAQHEAKMNVEGFWEFLPQNNRAMYIIKELVRFDEMVVIDDKGDNFYHYPHIFVDFKGDNGPFHSVHKYLESKDQQYDISDYKRIDIFPGSFDKPKIGTIYKDKAVTLDKRTLMLMNRNDASLRLYDCSKKYAFLEPRDVISVENTNESEGETTFIQITHKHTTQVKDYLQNNDTGYLKQPIEEQVGRKVKQNEPLVVYEFKQIYEWEFN
ncbi:MAG: restriction endonuclease [Candidatus Thiodiazotropha endolucinida]